MWILAVGNKNRLMVDQSLISWYGGLHCSRLGMRASGIFFQAGDLSSWAGRGWFAPP